MPLGVDAFGGDLCAALGGPVRVGRWLQAAAAEARRRWPQVRVAPDAFARHVAAVTGAAGSPAALPGHGPDLYLALACCSGDGVALEHFEVEILTKALPVLRRLRLDAPDIDDVIQRVRTRLLVADGAPPRLASYRGAGPLVQWVRAVAGREGLALLRRSRVEVPFEDLLVEVCYDPSLDALKQQYRTEFKRAVAEAVGGLGARERTILRAIVVDRATAAQIGAVFGAHRVTVQRWLRSIRSQLLAATRANMAERLALSRTELDSALDLIESRMTASLTSLLAGEPALSAAL